jgi:orotate phosphoribosyltransferase
MPDTEHDFLTFAIDSGVLGFGEFTLKSGRISPYFLNAGLFNTGPAYKGIALAAATAAALYQDHDRNVGFAYNRKESKDHGEGGAVVGAKLSGRVVIIDDVITAGTAIRESVGIIRAAGAEPAAVLVALDREEKVSEDGRSAVAQVREELGLPVHVIARFNTLIEHLRHTPDLAQHLETMEAYRARYGESQP